MPVLRNGIAGLTVLASVGLSATVAVANTSRPNLL